MLRPIDHFFAVAFLIGFFFSQNCSSQDMSPSISLGGAVYPSRDLKDAQGSYSHQAAFFRMNVPLVRSININEDGAKFYAVTLGFGTRVDDTRLTPLETARTFHTVNMSVSGVYKSSLKSIWISRINVSSFEDQYTIDHPQLRPSGLVLYKRSTTKNFFYLAGAAYTFSYGRGLPVPVLGAGWIFSDHSSLTAVLPLSIRYKFGPIHHPFTLFLRPNGAVSNLGNRGLYSDAPQQMIFRRRELALGVSKRQTLSDQWSISIEAGILAGRKIAFTKDLSRSEPDTYFKSGVKPGLYLSFNVRYKFHRNSEHPESIIDLDSF